MDGEPAELSSGGGGGGGAAAGSVGEGVGVAFVVDSEVTGFLMMGALTPNCKKHSGGRAVGRAGGPSCLGLGWWADWVLSKQAGGWAGGWAHG